QPWLPSDFCQAARAWIQAWFIAKVETSPTSRIRSGVNCVDSTLPSFLRIRITPSTQLQPSAHQLKMLCLSTVKAHPKNGRNVHLSYWRPSASMTLSADTTNIRTSFPVE